MSLLPSGEDDWALGEVTLDPSTLLARSGQSSGPASAVAPQASVEHPLDTELPVR